MYGRPPGEINPVLMEKALGQEKPIDCAPAQILEPGYEKAKAEIGQLARNEEDILTYALFPSVARDFLKKKYAP
jgi:pyruvate/oxaloacetate carboxyltransferase